MKRRTVTTFCLVIISCGWVQAGSAGAPLHPSVKLPMPISDSATAQRSEADPRVRKYILPVRVVWHSAEGVENPYFGASMFACGEVRETVKRAQRLSRHALKREAPKPAAPAGHQH